MPSPRRSLARRVGGAAALSALFAGMLTLAVAGLVVDRRIVAAAEDNAQARARAVVEELDAELEGSDLTPEHRAELESEVAEFEYGGVAVAIASPQGHEAGSPLPDPGAEGCSHLTHQGAPWLVCRASSSNNAHWVLVGLPHALAVAHRQPLIVGGLVALFAAALGGLLAGWAVGRWSLDPLRTLRSALRRDRSVEVDAPLPRSGSYELDELAETLEDLFARLAQETKRSRRFSADAAHELRTPLAKLRAELELMAEDADEAERARLDRQVGRVEQVTVLLDRLLVLASPAPSLQASDTVSLTAVVEGVVQDLSDPTRVRTSLDDDALVKGDAVILATVVANAVDNALKFSPGVVDVATTRCGETVVLRVDDDGPGLTEAQRARAFEAFYRAGEHREREGHGIGLALIEHIVSAHGGRVHFADATPGAHLVIELPAVT